MGSENESTTHQLLLISFSEKQLGSGFSKRILALSLTVFLMYLHKEWEERRFKLSGGRDVPLKLLTKGSFVI